MAMKAENTSDWEKLGRLAFRRREKIGAIFKRVKSLSVIPQNETNFRSLLILRNWMLVPLTLWPIDIAGLAEHVCMILEAKKPLDRRFAFILEQLQHLPTQKAQDAVAEYEKYVEEGNYEPLIRAESMCKYSLHEAELLKNRTLQEEWNTLKTLFDVCKYRDKRGIIRRRMAQERNFRPDWAFRWRTVGDRFKSAFDAFCHRWNLYGMEGDKPLLLKLSVNPTAHGLMIVIPSFWSFDLKRDLNAQAISKLHRSRGALRQGAKMSGGRLERHEQAKRAYEADQIAKTRLLRGANRRDFVIQAASLPSTFDERCLRRLINEGSKL
jgi:hypothetical protein